MKILALDLGKFNSVCCLYDSKTRNTKFLTTPTKREQLQGIFENEGKLAELVVMESCGPSGWINDLAVSLGLSTLVCSTNEEAWRWANVKRKTDKDDALKLARMAAMGELKSVHMPSPQHREFRSLVKYRKTLDGRINKTKNTIRAWFVNHGIEIDKGDKAWHTGRERINSFRKPIQDCTPGELWKGQLDIELTILDSLSLQLDTVVKKLEQLGKDDERVKRLRTIPGVGPRTAEILVACFDDPHRFENGRQVSAYFGLVPRQYQSGETDRNGRITKRGNPLARTILVECAWASLRYNPWAKNIYERICGKQKTRKKKAGIALARKIAVIAWAMLRDQKDWEPKRMIEVTESFGPMPAELKETLTTMKPKENSDQRKSRLRREARQATVSGESSKANPTKQSTRRSSNSSGQVTKKGHQPQSSKQKQKSASTKSKPRSRTKAKRSGKRVSRS
ncbi:IS110 family transposase [Roseiconus lacunae]|uniref:IS110 family transposase n=1 Tax=Roseiconus lacunae TaxID=2605694 RepID=UPI003089643A|nr:IS110 family transposase [Stieleria sp. HD01]WRQ50627.1 IS110 family transposase [Stieleria sp. HD01]WRQ50632.1 IS110 family transposase [Stieleria sp. HD01]WRQ50640.1 IS110 family transposase [Stieleria sp. HD01]WRQ51761.1 IS110 family transposase [Stieleria sp. HD01]